MLGFYLLLTTKVECLHIRKTIKYLKEQSGIVLAGYTASQTRKSWGSITQQSICVSFPCLQMKKKSEGCNHSTVQSVTFVLFGSRVFSIRWQGLRIMKYKMDSFPQIVYFIEHHKYKYAQILECSSSFSPFSHQLISAISKKRNM